MPTEKEIEDWIKGFYSILPRSERNIADIFWEYGSVMPCIFAPVSGGALLYTKNKESIIIEAILVDPRQRRKGIGNALVRQLIKSNPGVMLFAGTIDENAESFFIALKFDIAPDILDTNLNYYTYSAHH